MSQHSPPLRRAPCVFYQAIGGTHASTSSLASPLSAADARELAAVLLRAADRIDAATATGTV